jgi:hypothetical protein
MVMLLCTIHGSLLCSNVWVQPWAFWGRKEPSLIYQCVFTKYKLFSPYRTLCTREVDIGRLASHWIQSNNDSTLFLKIVHNTELLDGFQVGITYQFLYGCAYTVESGIDYIFRLMSSNICALLRWAMALYTICWKKTNMEWSNGWD